MMARRTYLDLDGVMADLDQAFFNMHGVYPNGMPDKQFWPMVNQNPTFFADLPMCPGAAAFFETLKFFNIKPIILTACPNSDYQRVAVQKRAWVSKNLGPDLTVLPVNGSKNKWLFMHQKGDILIDDYHHSIDPWVAAGGVGVLHCNFEDTWREYAKLLSIHLPADSVSA